MIANKDTWEEVQHVLIMQNSTNKENMEDKSQSNAIMISDVDTKIANSECMITGVKQSSNTNKQIIDTSTKPTDESEADDAEQREIKRRKLLETIENETEDLQEDISEQVDSLLGELKQRKSEGPLVIVSSNLSSKNNQSLSSENQDSSDMKNSLAKSLINKDSAPVSSQELSGPRFITSTDIKNNQFNLLVMQPESSKGSNLTEYKTTFVGVDLSQINDVDLVEWHRQTGDIVARRLIQSTVNVRKLQTVVTKLYQQLSNEKTINKIKANKIRELENQIASIINAKKDNYKL
jgi:hypothetical protein